MISRKVALLLFICVSLATFAFISPPSFIEDLISKSNEKRATVLKESVFIHTDRNSYNQGDTLWLKGYINDFTSGMPSEISQTISVKIIDQNNKLIVSNDYYNEQGKIDGAINIPTNLDDGEYNLVAYTSTMKNYSEEWYFVKSIYLKSLRASSQIIPNLNIKINYDKTEYKAGDEIVAKFSFVKKDNEQVNKTTIEYVVESDKEIIKSFKGEAINSGDINIRFKAPRDVNNVSILVKIKNRDQSLSYTSMVPLRSRNLVVSFFPEGGEIIRNLTNRVAFQATDSLGNAINITGYIVDEKGKKIKAVTTEHNGLGLFNFVPVKNKEYLLSVDNLLIPLPEIRKKGVNFTIVKITEDTLTVRVNSNFNSHKKIYLSATMRERVYWGIEGQVEQTALINIPLSEIPKGILQLTLFDESKQPVLERLYYVNRHKGLKINISPNKTSFISRDSTSLQIKVTDHNNKPVQTELSLAAKDALFDANGLNKLNTNIDSYFSFSSQLHGKWRQELNKSPVWNEEKTSRVLDLMLLVYGWRKFEWNKLSTIDTLIDYELIRGRVTKGRKKVSINAQVDLFSFNSNEAFTTYTDSSGYFSFDKRILNKLSTSLAVSSFFEDKPLNLRLSMEGEASSDSLPSYSGILTGQIKYRSDRKSPDRTLEVVNFTYYQFLQEVIIMENRLQEEENPILEKFSNVSVASKSGEELVYSSDIVGLIGQVTTIQFHDTRNNRIFFRAANRSAGALYVLDGFVIGNDYSSIINISPENIKHLSVLKGLAGTYVYGSRAQDGVVFITTKATSNDTEPETAKNIAFLNGYSKKRMFYSPKYRTNEQRENPIPDLRKTLYWNPNVTTDENGEAVVSYYNSDRKSTINVSVQGMSKEGFYGSVNTSYIVIPKD
jgi:5-hydroxyisourate hydrolase-like protein (transthyretin family)